MRTAAIVIGVVLVVVVLLVGGVVIGRLIATDGDPFGPDFDRDFGPHHRDFWGVPNVGGVAVLVILLILGLVCLVPLGIVGLVWWLASRERGGQGAGSESSLDILRRRYAEGEITREEFEERRATLTDRSTGGNQG